MNKNTSLAATSAPPCDKLPPLCGSMSSDKVVGENDTGDRAISRREDEIQTVDSLCASSAPPPPSGKLKRILANREHAKTSYLRKKKSLKDLKKRLFFLLGENKTLKDENERIREDIRLLDEKAKRAAGNLAPMIPARPRLDTAAGPGIQIADSFPTASMRMLRHQKAQNVGMNHPILSQAGLHSVSFSEGTPILNNSVLSHTLPTAATVPHISQTSSSLQDARRVALPSDTISLQMRPSQSVLGPTVNLSMQNQHNSMFPALSRILSTRNAMVVPSPMYTPLNSMNPRLSNIVQPQLNPANQNLEYARKVKSFDPNDEECLLQDDYIDSNVRRVTNEDI